MGCVAKYAPYVPLWDLTANLVRIALQSSVSNYDGADRSWSIFPRPVCRIPICSARNYLGEVRIHLFTVHSLNFAYPSASTRKNEDPTAQTSVMDGLESRHPRMQSSKRAAKFMDLRRFVPGRGSEQSLLLNLRAEVSTPNLHHAVHLSNGAASLHLLPQT
jgi:hypothetical protein